MPARVQDTIHRRAVWNRDATVHAVVANHIYAKISIRGRAWTGTPGQSHAIGMKNDGHSIFLGAMNHQSENDPILGKPPIVLRKLEVYNTRLAKWELKVHFNKRYEDPVAHSKNQKLRMDRHEWISDMEDERFRCIHCSLACGPEYPEICSLRRWWISRPFWDDNDYSQGRLRMDILYDCCNNVCKRSCPCGNAASQRMPYNEYGCTYCHKAILKGTVVPSCRACDWDCCSNCGNCDADLPATVTATRTHADLNPPPTQSCAAPVGYDDLSPPTTGWTPFWRGPCPYKNTVLNRAASPGPTLRVVTAGHRRVAGHAQLHRAASGA